MNNRFPNDVESLNHTAILPFCFFPGLKTRSRMEVPALTNGEEKHQKTGMLLKISLLVAWLQINGASPSSPYILNSLLRSKFT